MKNRHIQEYLDLTSTQSFLVCANELVQFLETPDMSMNISDYLRLLERKLAKVYAVWLELEIIKITYDFGKPTNPNKLKGVDYSILTKLKESAFYCDVFNPICYNTYIQNENLEAIWTEVTQW